jgi:hypothetical protein
MAAARKKRETRGRSKNPEEQPANGPAWDPAAKRTGAGDGQTPQEKDERAFHATHFSADPRGAAMAGKAPPGASSKHRAGTPPSRSGPVDV